MDGKTFTQKSTGGSTGDITLQKRMPFTIKTLNDDYEIVFLSEGWDGKIHLVGSDYDFFNYEWMHCEGDGGKLNFTVDQYTPNSMNADPEERTGYALAFSRAEYENIKDKLEETIVQNGEIAYKYEQSNLLIAFTQKDVKEEPDNKSFTIKKGGWEIISATQTTNTAILEFLKGNYSIDDVYSITANAGEYFSIYPLLSESEWAGEVYVINIKDEDVTANKEVSMDGEGMFLGITIPDNFDEDLIVVFKGTDYFFKKALVITPAN